MQLFFCQLWAMLFLGFNADSSVSGYNKNKLFENKLSTGEVFVVVGQCFKQHFKFSQVFRNIGILASYSAFPWCVAHGIEQKGTSFLFSSGTELI